MVLYCSGLRNINMVEYVEFYRNKNVENFETKV